MGKEQFPSSVYFYIDCHHKVWPLFRVGLPVIAIKGLLWFHLNFRIFLSVKNIVRGLAGIALNV